MTAEADDGLPLGRAIYEEWGEPALLDELRRATAHHQSLWDALPDASDRERAELEPARLAAEDEVRRIRWEIEGRFRLDLARGAFVATGRRHSDGNDGARHEVPRDLWHRLLLLVPKGAARNAEHFFVDVRVRLPGLRPDPPRDAVARDPAEVAGDGERGPGRAGAPVARSRGRPSVLGRIRDELHRRAAEGRLSGDWTADAKDLHRWALANIHGAVIPRWDSIYRRLRTDYRALRSDEKAG